MFETRITKLFGIKYPIVGGAMHPLSTPEFVAAISNAGCLGIMVSTLTQTPEELREAIRKVKSLTDKPFGLNINLFPSVTPVKTEDLIAAAVEEEVPVIETSGRSPEPYIQLLRSGKGKYIHKCARPRDAVKAASLGADAVTIVGCECGGHPGLDDVTTMVVAPMTVDAVSIPVIAGGGIVDGRGLVAALALGADGVIMGTRFMATKECAIHANIKEWMLKATEADTMIIDRSLRNNTRVAKNEPALKVAELEARGATLEELLPYISGTLGRKLLTEGDMNAGILAVGQVVGRIRDIPTIQEVVERVMSEAEEVRQRLNRC